MGQFLLLAVLMVLLAAMAFVIGADRDDPERNLSASCLLWGVIGVATVVLILIAIWIMSGGGFEGVDRAPQSVLPPRL